MDIFNAAATLTPQALSCFTSAPRKLVLQPGDNLYRFGTIVSQTFRGNEIFSSPWWIPAETYRRITKTAHQTNRNIVEVARSRLAIATDWNPKMDWLTILELTKPVYAWVGPARPQPFSGGHRSVMLLGHYEQAFVPGLAPPESMASDAAKQQYFGALS